MRHRCRSDELGSGSYFEFKGVASRRKALKALETGHKSWKKKKKKR